MIRRRRPAREIAFSFDSFLDVVANVVGIIIRLILVVWVGARSYGTLSVISRPATSRPSTAAPASPQAGAPAAVEEPPEPDDPVRQELARHRKDLADAQARLLEQLRRLQQIKDDQGQVGAKVGEVQTRRQDLDREQAALEGAAAAEGEAVR